MLFRPEEVVHRSAATLLNPARIRIHAGDRATVYFYADWQVAFGAGVFEGETLVFVIIAVDQQQEVDRSPNIEGLFAFDVHRVEVVLEGTAPPFIAFGK